MIQIEWALASLLISALGFCVSTFFGMRNNKRSGDEELKARIARDTRTEMTLNEIAIDVKEVKETVNNIQKDIKDHEGRITKLEASYEAEHKRIDEVVVRLENLEKLFSMIKIEQGGNGDV